MTREQAHAEFSRNFYVDIRSKEMAETIMRLLLDESSFFTDFSHAFSMFKKGKNIWPENGRYLRISDGNCSFRKGKTIYDTG